MKGRDGMGANGGRGERRAGKRAAGNGGGFGRFMAMHAFFLVSWQIQTVFVNTYLLRAAGEAAAVTKFNMVLAAVQPPAMLLAAAAVRRRGTAACRHIAFGLYGAVYGVLAVLGERAAGHYGGVGAALAAAAGLYYTAYSVSLLACTGNETRDRAMGTVSLITGGVTLAVPALSGPAVAAFDGFAGYRLLFAAALAAVALSALVGRKLPAAARAGERARFGRAAAGLVKSAAGRCALAMALVSGIRAGTMAFYLNLLVFRAAQGEGAVGLNTLLSGGAALAGAALYRRAVKPHRRAKALLLAVGGMLIACVPLFFTGGAAALMAFSMLYGGSGPFIDNPPYSAYLLVCQKLPALQGAMAEVHALREHALSFGKVLGLAVTLLLPGEGRSAVWVIALLLAVQLLQAAFIRRIGREFAER